VADHAGLVLCAMYWHALDVIWVVLYATLLAFSN
jgi:heme/copper-type cytochrome/quinol oxidase subunit 3